jgi:hypothetical protein
MRLKSLKELIALVIVALCSLALLGWGGTSAWFASPASPIVSPVYSPVPIVSTPGALDLIEPAAPLWRASLWTSPLPWVAVGLPFFGLFAWALSAVLRRSRPEPP